MIPYGEKVKDLGAQDLLRVLMNDGVKKVLGRHKTVRLDGSVTCQWGYFKFEVFVYDYKIVKVLVRKVNTNIKVEGVDALKILVTLVYEALAKRSLYKVECSVYKVDKKLYRLGEQILSCSVLDMGDGDKLLEKIMDKSLVKFEEKRTVESVLEDLKDFTGIVEGEGEGYYAKVFLKKGKIVGAYVRDDDDEYMGNQALYFLDVPCKITISRQIFLNVPEEYRVQEVDLSTLEETDERVNEIVRRVMRINEG